MDVNEIDVGDRYEVEGVNGTIRTMEVTEKEEVNGYTIIRSIQV